MIQRSKILAPQLNDGVEPVGGTLAAQAAIDALDALGVALLVCSPCSQIVTSNATARRVEGIAPLVNKDGRIVAGDELATRRLWSLIRAVSIGASAPTRFQAGPQCSGGEVRISRFCPDRGEADLAMVLVGNAPNDPPVCSTTEIRLTPSESRLLRALTAGQSLSDYAALSGVSRTTVKTHLENLFDKIGVRRQSDLIRRAFCDPALRSYVQ